MSASVLPGIPLFALCKNICMERQRVPWVLEKITGLKIHCEQFKSCLRQILICFWGYMLKFR